MAARRTIDLGTVGFGLVPDTRALEQSLTVLKKYGKEVERLGQVEDEIVQKQYRKFAAIERTLSSLLARTIATTARMREAGVAVPEIDKVEQAYKRVNRTLTEQADLLTKAQISRATVGMSAVLGAGNRLAGVGEINKFALGFRDLERAAILALGPLSGIGARLAVMSALFDSTSVKMALFIGGITGVAAGTAMLATAGVKAVIDMQRFDAQLTSSTGSAALTGDAYTYVLGVANKLGQNVRSLIEPYAKFTTAARLSNVTLEDQRKIFEAATIAGTAMKLNGERMGLVFLALEQMLSKGTVSMEELRRQLGDLLPGSFELAAKSMGVTTSEFAKMIKSGEVMAKDMLPKLATLWVQVFGPGALQAAENLQAEMQRVGTSVFELLKRFDQAAGFSEIFRKTVVATRETLDFLARNMEQIISLFGALAGAGAGMAVLMIFSKLPALIAATASAVRALTAATLALDFALIVSGWGAILKQIAKVAIVLGGAAIGYAYLTREQKAASETMDEWITKSKDWIGVQEEIGSAHKQTTEQMKQGTATRLRLVYAELGAIQAQLAAALAQAESAAQNSAARMTLSRGGRSILAAPPDPSQDPTVKALQARLEKVKEISLEMENFLERANVLKIDKPNVGEVIGTQWGNWIKKIQENIRTFTSLSEQIKAADLGHEAMQQAEALGKALEMMADQPEKQRGSLANISRSLREAGFEGKNLTEQLTAMFLAIDKNKESLKEIEAFPKKFATAGAAIRKMFEDVGARREAALSVRPEELAQQKQLELHVVALTQHLNDQRLAQEKVNEIVEAFRQKWKEMAEAETASAQIKKVTQELERLDNQIGDTTHRSLEQFKDRMDLAFRALQLGIGSIEDYWRRVQVIQDDLSRTVLDRTTLFGRGIREVFRDIENSIADSMARTTLGLETSWRDVFNKIAQEALSFVYKMAVVQPIMEALFGNLYTQKGGAGQGLLEPFLRAMTGTKGTSTYNPGNLYQEGEAPIDWGGNYATGGSFIVGGSGAADSRMIAMGVTPGERIDVMTPDQQQRGMMPSIQVVINNQSGVPMEASQGAPRMEGDRMVVDLLVRRLTRDAGARNQLRGLLASAPEY